VEEHEGGRRPFWETARVVSGKLIGINKNTNEITIETKGEDDERFEEDYELPADFEHDQFEELLDYLDFNIRVVLLDSTVIKVINGETLR